MKVKTLIIGSGVAATALANRLLAHDRNADILLLEAGQKVKMKDSVIWHDYVVSGRLPYTQYYDLPYPDRDRAGENVNAGRTTIPLEGARAFTYGGSTIHWGGWCFRLKPEDFALNRNAGYSLDWPFAYDELEPWYCAAEHYIGVSGDSQDATVPRSQGYPFPAFPYTLEDEPVASAMDTLGIGYSHLPIARHGITDTVSRHAPCQTTGTCKYCPFGARYSANNFLDDMLLWGDYPNFRVRLHSVVEQIVVSAKGRAAGAIVRDAQTGERLTIEADTVIVAAGTIESSKLLLRSTSTFWPNGIGNDHDLVGRNIVTHPYFIFTASLPANPLRLQAEMNFPTLVSRHFDSPTEQAKGKFILVNPPDGSSVNLLTQMQAGVQGADLDRYVTGPTHVQLHGMLEVFSEAGNRVANSHKTNRMGLPETFVDYSQAPSFTQRIHEIQSHVERVFETMGATLTGAPSISWRADHAACTCRMSDSPDQGVTDLNLRVHGMENLYVCSSAVFPNTGAVNPTLTLTALALRLGEHLGQQLVAHQGTRHDTGRRKAEAL
jgi:choline dehydrogenase-like flavoprotein